MDHLFELVVNVYYRFGFEMTIKKVRRKTGSKKCLSRAVEKLEVEKMKLFEKLLE